jgi:ABC-type uncharacterized transport system permease subunit
VVAGARGLALVFGWLAFRSRVTGVYLSILTQAMTLALSLYLFQNDTGLRGNNGLSGLQNIPGADHRQDRLSVWFFWASALCAGAGLSVAAWLVSGKFGNIVRGIRDDEARVRFLGYPVEVYKLVVFTLSAMICGVRGALLSAGGHHQSRRDRADRVDLPGGLGRHRRARAALWRGHRRGGGVASVDLFTSGRRRCGPWASMRSTGSTGGRCCWASASCW